MALKTREVKFPEFLQPADLKPEILNIMGLGFGRAGRVLLKRQLNKPSCRDRARSSSLKNVWGIWEGEFTNLRVGPRGTEIVGKLLQEQRSGQVLFLSPDPQQKHTAIWRISEAPLPI